MWRKKKKFTSLLLIERKRKKRVTKFSIKRRTRRKEQVRDKET